MIKFKKIVKHLKKLDSIQKQNTKVLSLHIMVVTILSRTLLHN